MKLSILIFIILISQKISAQNINKSELKDSFSAISIKPKLIDFYTVWCAPCKKMDNTTLKDSSVLSLIKRDFFFQKVNAESETGKILSNKYNVNEYPTFVLSDSASGYVSKIVGYQDPSAFLAFLNKYLKRDDLIFIRDFISLKAYLLKLGEIGKTDLNNFDEYSKTIEKSKWVLDYENLLILNNHISTCESPYFNLITENFDNSDASSSSKSLLESTYRKAILNCKEKAIATNDINLLNKVLNYENNKASTINKSAVIFNIQEQFYKKTKNDIAYKMLILDYCDSLSNLDSVKILRILKGEYDYLVSRSKGDFIKKSADGTIIDENKYIDMYLMETIKLVSQEINYYANYFIKSNNRNSNELEKNISYLRKAYQLYPDKEYYLTAAKLHYLIHGKENNPFIELLENEREFQSLFTKYLNFIKGE